MERISEIDLKISGSFLATIKIYIFICLSVFLPSKIRCKNCACITTFHRWFREEREQLSPVSIGDRISLLSAGLLKISKVHLDDKGKYLCWVNNSAGEETVQVTLTVTGMINYLMFNFI